MSESHQLPEQTPTVWGTPPTPRIEPGAGAPGDAPPLGGSAPGVDGQPERKKVSTMAKTLTAVGVAAVIAVGGTIAVTSANASGSSTSAQSAPGSGGQGGPGGFGGGTGTGTAGGTGGTGSTGTDAGSTGTGMRGGGFGEMAVIGSALHGEFVVADGTGTITERIQTGAVTAVGSTSITVKSTDGYSASYTLTSGLDVSTFTIGTDVTVIAKVSGTAVTATSVTAARTGVGMGAGGAGSGAPGGAGSGAPGGAGSGGAGSGAPGGTDSGAPTI